MKKALIALLVCTSAAQAHEVHHRIEATDAVVITLSYANGQPFAYEKYALTPVGETTPRQVGNTDGAGRIVFAPDQIERWHMQATSADGHGVNLEFSVPATGKRAAAAPAASETAPRWLLAGLGLSLIFGLFGLVQLFVRKKP